MTNNQVRLISLALLAIAGAIALTSGGLGSFAGLLVLFGAVWMFVYDYMHLGKSDDSNETRCRKCNYILRGIREPRCPECGEVI